MKSVATPTTQFTLRDDGIVIAVDLNPELVRTHMNVAATFDALEQLIEGKPRPSLWVPRPVKAYPPEAWSVLIRRLDTSVSALAIVADEGARQAIGIFPAAIGSLLVPTRVFDNETDAVEWLQQFANDTESCA